MKGLPGFSVTAPWAFNWFLVGNENKVDISIVGTNGKFFLINAHGVLRRMGAATEIPGNVPRWGEQQCINNVLHVSHWIILVLLDKLLYSTT